MNDCEINPSASVQVKRDDRRQLSVVRGPLLICTPDTTDHGQRTTDYFLSCHVSRFHVSRRPARLELQPSNLLPLDEIDRGLLNRRHEPRGRIVAAGDPQELRFSDGLPE